MFLAKLFLVLFNVFCCFVVCTCLCNNKGNKKNTDYGVLWPQTNLPRNIQFCNLYPQIRSFYPKTLKGLWSCQYLRHWITGLVFTNFVELWKIFTRIRASTIHLSDLYFQQQLQFCLSKMVILIKDAFKIWLSILLYIVWWKIIAWVRSVQHSISRADGICEIYHLWLAIWPFL